MVEFFGRTVGRPFFVRVFCQNRQVMPRLLARFFSQPPLKKRLFLWAWVLLLRFDLLLRAASFRRAERIRPIQVAQQPAPPLETILWAVNAAAAHHLYPMTCLRRALTLRYLLAKGGIVSNLCFGVRYEGETFAAHAWIELNDQPFGERIDPTVRYVKMEKMPVAIRPPTPGLKHREHSELQ